MDPAREEFEEIVGAILQRFCRQRGDDIPVSAHIARCASQLWDVVRDRGLPRPLSAEERGTPGGLPEAEFASLVERVTRELPSPVLGEAARQLLKACLYPEFKVCRDSYREVSRDGTCRRQELERVRTRISGAHCVDCPHWVSLDPEQHRRFLRAEWRGDPTMFDAHRDTFLPEDFRALRCWVQAEARRQWTA